MSITENYKRIRQEIPDYVKIAAAAKTRTKEDIEEIINAGAADIGRFKTGVIINDSRYLYNTDMWILQPGKGLFKKVRH